MKSSHAATAALFVSVTLLGGCASTPPEPTTEMTRAQAAIEQAQRAGAGEYANDSLAASNKNMALAQVAIAKHDNAEAARLVEESYADAHLAQITAQSAKSAKDAADVDKSIETLRSESTRPASP